MSFGIRVWDASGAEIFSEEFYTARVQSIVRVRGGVQSGPITVAAPGATPDMTAFAVPVGRVLAPVAFRGYWNSATFQQASLLGALPTVSVGYGVVTFSSYVERLGSFNYSANVDVILVNT